MDPVGKKAPQLVALLARAGGGKPLPFRLGSPSTIQSPKAIGSSYSPSSTSAFIARLATFSLKTYANKPAAIDAVAAAKAGWVNDGKDRLVCGICSVSWVLAGTAGMNRDAGMYELQSR